MMAHEEVRRLDLSYKQAELLVDAVATHYPGTDPTPAELVSVIEQDRELLEGEWDADAAPLLERLPKLSPEGCRALLEAVRHVLDHEDAIDLGPYLATGLIAEEPDPGTL